MENHQKRRVKGRRPIVHSPSLFVMGVSEFLEAAYKEKLGEHAGVLFPGFCSESKEDEKDKCADDPRPPGEGVSGDEEVVCPPHDCRNLSDTAETIVSLFPADPWHDRGGGRV